MPDLVNPESLLVALDKAGGDAFEKFGQAFYSSLVGAEFVPLGGMHDGGADGFIASGLYFEVGATASFLQVSIEENVDGKIKQTVKRLREVGRAPDSLTYVSSRTVPKIDLLERNLSRDLGLTVRIRDKKYIEVHINDSSAARASFINYLAHLVKPLGASNKRPLTLSKHVASAAVYVFLRQELDRQADAFSLTDAMVDALILWGLEGTDPDQGIFRTRESLTEKVLAAVPASKSLLADRLDARLQFLATKDYPGGRGVRWHKKDDKFALPFHTRSELDSENLSDEALRVRVFDSFEAELTEKLGGLLGSGSPGKGAQVAIRTLELLFEREGIEFANFLTSTLKSHGEALHSVLDCLDDALTQIGVPGPNRQALGDAVLEVLRNALYYGSDDQRLLFAKWARTYTLLFAIRAEPRILEYLDELVGDFYLYVGSDIIVQALSERYLPGPSQLTRNALRMARDAGATLVLAGPVLDEVLAHVRASDKEFQNWFRATESSITLEIARHAPKILIRAYFYAKTYGNGQKPATWWQFLNQFCDPGQLHEAAGYGQLKAYLQSEFGLVFETKEELLELAKLEEVTNLAAALQQHKSRAVLAFNDALMTLSVYGRRHQLKEHSTVSEFGARTWWLTGESKILPSVGHIVEAHHGERFMMRPEFLVRFLALAPNNAAVRRTYKNVFPTILGVQLGRRIPEAVFHKLMQDVREAQSLEPGRRKAKIGGVVDALKAEWTHRPVAGKDESAAPSPEPATTELSQD